MEDQVTSKESKIWNVLLVVLAALLAASLAFWAIHAIQMSDPYVQQVLALTGDSQQGKAIFEMNCSGCHGLDAQGEVGPRLWKVSERRSQRGLIHQVTSGQTPPMPKFQASPAEMADLLSYLNTL